MLNNNVPLAEWWREPGLLSDFKEILPPIWVLVSVKHGDGSRTSSVFCLDSPGSWYAPCEDSPSCASTSDTLGLVSTPLGTEQGIWSGPERICLTLDSGGALADGDCFSLDVATCLDTSPLPEAWSSCSSPEQTLRFSSHAAACHWSGTNGRYGNCISWVPRGRLRRILNRNIDLL